MSDNVIILGAGASADAGIPLMGQFMDTMWNVARRGRRSGNVSPRLLEILEEALKVREELDGYHGRAAFDVWNIEDILSILSFSNQKSLERMTKAIASMIEQTCHVVHDGRLNQHPQQVDMYMNFWRALIAWSQKSKAPVPSILTFNYDLVLERSLLRALIGKYYRHSVEFKHDGVEVAYAVNDEIRLKAVTGTWRDENFREERGLILEEFAPDTKFDGLNLLKFEILKLHGSVNFPKSRRGGTLRTSVEQLINALDDPLILPPVFNKATDAVGKKSWERALQVLRKCKNLVICGYSLPKTDIYMQFFLKAALGPNQDLNKIYVFDPDLFRSSRREQGDALRDRYASNFSQPIQRRIEFHPATPRDWDENSLGTMKHFTWLLAHHPETVLFS